jgi:hypothetical protein
VVLTKTSVTQFVTSKSIFTSNSFFIFIYPIFLNVWRKGDLKLYKAGTNSSKEELSHTHFRGVVDPEFISTVRELHSVKWSFIGLMFTALFQIYVFRISGSVALLADIIRNFGDAVTAIPPGFAFLLSLKNLTTDSLTVTAEQKTLQVC